MKENLTKDQYLLPECRVIEIHLTKVIATSPGGDNEGFTSENGTW